MLWNTVPCPKQATPLPGQVDQVLRTSQIPAHCRPRKASGLLNINPQSETVCTLCCAIPMCMLTLFAYRFCSLTLPQNIRRHLDVWKCVQIAPTRNPAGHGRLHLSRRRRDEIHIRTRQSLMRRLGRIPSKDMCYRSWRMQRGIRTPPAKVSDSNEMESIGKPLR